MNTNRGYAYAPVYGSKKTNPLLEKVDHRMTNSEPDFSEMNIDVPANEGQNVDQFSAMNTPVYGYAPYVNPPYPQMPNYTENMPVGNPAYPTSYPPYPAADYYGVPYQQSAVYPANSFVPQPIEVPAYQLVNYTQPVSNPEPKQPLSRRDTVPAFAAADRMDNPIYEARVSSARFTQQNNSESMKNQPAGGSDSPNHERKPMHKPEHNPDRIWFVYFFFFLPILFVPCLFVTGSLTMLRYIFILLCTVGLIVVKKKALFSSNLRLILYMLYPAMSALLLLMFVPISSTQQQQQPAVSSYHQGPISIGVTESAIPTSYQAIDLLMTESPIATPEPTPPMISEAQSRLTAFMNYWMERNTGEMVNYVQPSWRNMQSDAPTSLFTLLANRTPESFQIEEVSGGETDTSRTVTMTASINKNNGKPNVTYRFTIMMVKESDNWYVNPNSLASNDTVDAAESIVVNDSNSKTVVTPAPRTTVTPEPPASTTLYYNDNGGNYYHIDQFCPSVKDEFLPLRGTFPYREMSEYVRTLNLQPCLKCGAPINPPSSTNEQ